MLVYNAQTIPDFSPETLSHFVRRRAGTLAGHREKSDMYPRFTLAAGALALVAVFPSIAADKADDVIVVTATRFEQTAPQVAANITVISREDIKNTPAQSVPDVLGSHAGIFVSPINGGSMGRNATIDMRGFGATATSNTLILIDGQRINPVDMGTITWSSIPLDSVERIEILRGSGTVLFGDGASGGVINIITNKRGKQRLSAAATLGSFGYKGADFQAANSNDQAYFNLFANTASSNGYRDNAQQDQTSVSGRAGLLLDRGEVFVDFANYKETGGLPGSIFSAAYHNDPRSTRTPRNREERDGYRFRPGVSYQLSSTLALEAEIAVEHQKLNSHFFASSGNSSSDRTRDTVGFTPRLRWNHGLSHLASETVIGYDYYDGTMDSDNVGYASTGASQQSSALYVQNTTGLTETLSLTTGARQQRMAQKAHQDAYAPFGSAAMEGKGTRSQSAYDLGLAYKQQDWRVYGKTGTTFRFANLDELFGTDPVTFAPVFAGDIKPQHGTINEVGGSASLGPVTLRGSAYQLKLEDEIGYNGSKNTNLDPTRRRGIELEADWKISSALKLKAAYTHINAEFRSGSNAGNDLPQVPQNQASAHVIWDSGKTGTYTALVRYVGDRPYGGDFRNAQPQADSYTTLDLQADWSVHSWRITAKLLNATDEKYSPFSGYSSTRGLYYYPADGRAFFVTAGYAF